MEGRDEEEGSQDGVRLSISGVELGYWRRGYVLTVSAAAVGAVSYVSTYECSLDDSSHLYTLSQSPLGLYSRHILGR